MAAEDDTLWNAAKYVRRMDKRLQEKQHACKEYKALVYQYGTHYVFPETLVKKLLPIGSSFLIGRTFVSAREHAKECKKTRIDIERELTQGIQKWINE